MECNWNPQRAAQFTALVGFLLMLAAPAAGQYQLITFDQPFQSQKLAGTVLDPSGASVMGVHIEDCDPAFNHVRASVFTDGNGHFAFRKGSNGATHYLRVIKDGFDPMHLTVQLKRSAEPALRIVLHIAT